MDYYPAEQRGVRSTPRVISQSLSRAREDGTLLSYTFLYRTLESVNKSARANKNKLMSKFKVVCKIGSNKAGLLNICIIPFYLMRMTVENLYLVLFDLSGIFTI